MDKGALISRLKEMETVQLLAEKHGKFIDKLREAKVWYNQATLGSAARIFCQSLSCFTANEYFVLFSQTASFLGPMAQLCHKYSNLAHTVWVDLFPQLWNLLTEKQQQVSLELNSTDPQCLTKDGFVLVFWTRRSF